MHSPIYSNSPMNISHPITKLVHKYLLSHYHIDPQNYTISIKSPNSFTLGAKPKKPNKTLQSPLLHDTSKTRCYMALLLSPLLHGNIFTKSQTIYKSLNTILETISKSPILFWQPFLKAQYYFSNYLQKSPNTSLAKFYKYSKAQVLSLAIF